MHQTLCLVIFLIALASYATATPATTEMFRQKLKFPGMILSTESLLHAFDIKFNALTPIKYQIVTYEMLNVISRCAQKGCHDFDKEMDIARSNVQALDEQCQEVAKYITDPTIRKKEEKPLQSFFSILKIDKVVGKSPNSLFKEYQILSERVLGEDTGKRFFSASALKSGIQNRIQVCQHFLTRAVDFSRQDFRIINQDAERVPQGKAFWYAMVKKIPFLALRGEFRREGSDHLKEIPPSPYGYNLKDSNFIELVDNIRKRKVEPEIKKLRYNESKWVPVKDTGMSCVCCDEVGTKVATECGHIFHIECLQQCEGAATNDLKCPVCRNPVDEVYPFLSEKVEAETDENLFGF